jgi:hypothetical protein
MPAYVGKGAQCPVLVPDQQDTLIAEIDGANLTRCHQLLEAPDANPGPLPEVFLLPRQHIGGGIGRGGEGQILPKIVDDLAELELV